MAEFDKLRELFPRTDPNVLAHHFQANQQNLNQTVEKLLELNINGDSGQQPKASSPAPSRTLVADVPPGVHPDYQRRQQQLLQVRQFLKQRGLEAMSASARRQYFQDHPNAFVQTKEFLTSIGLGNKNLGELQAYFAEVGLTFWLRPDTAMNMNALSWLQKEEFWQTGFLLVSSVVPKDLRDDALRVINRSISRGFSPVKTVMFNVATWCPELVTSSAILNLLYRSPAIALAGSLIGPMAQVQSSSIVLKFPGAGCLTPENTAQYSVSPQVAQDNFIPEPNWQVWDVDGVTNAPPNQMQNHTCLLVVFLSDVSNIFSGNVTVYPGSHLMVDKAMKHLGGPEKLASVRMQIPLQSPEQLRVRAGDVMICHSHLALCTAPNLSPEIRYAVYFKLHHAAHAPGTYRQDSLANMWLEYEGMREVLTAIARKSPQPSQAPSGPASRVCPSCGVTGLEGGKFCSYCGKPLP